MASVNIRLSKKYLVNKRTKEIHNLSNIQYQCFVNIIKDKIYISENELLDYISNGYNGCRWCNSKYDNG